MTQPTVVIQIFGYLQVAVHVEQNSHIAVWGFAYLRCHGLPAGVDLNKSEVM
jgi:hypothetical protein